MSNYITTPSARVLADSISPNGDRILSFEVTMHRFVLAEFNTHRAFSRNSASSRAIPNRLHRTRALTTPARPIVWPSKQSGMQGGPDIPQGNSGGAQAVWDRAASDAVYAAKRLDELGVHKSVTNRLLEPFLMQTVIITSHVDGLENFYEQRCSELAQPEIRVPAELMREAQSKSTPAKLDYGQYHMPLVNVDEQDTLALKTYWAGGHYDGDHSLNYKEFIACISAARCARVSYLTHDGRRDVGQDLMLYNRLTTAQPPHWSPLEHVATPAHDTTLGNLPGWHQQRHLV